ncbi:MAG: galactokinase [Bdellovibrionales bacterium]|nr:galactokinase [Bdellovibrionales bacterium]
MNKWNFRSPTRVDLAGGTLDCWPLYLFVDGAETTNLSINILTSADLTLRVDREIHLDIADLNYRNSFPCLEEFFKCTDAELNLVKAHIQYWQPNQGFNLNTKSESPVGAGLGGSSSLSISLIKVFSAMFDTKLSLHEMVELAHNIEAQVLKTPTGTQDYIPAIEPGLNIIHYSPRGFELERVEQNCQELCENLLLVYTGKPHHSGLNNWQVIKSIVDGDMAAKSCLRELKNVAHLVAQTCRKGQWDQLPQLFLLESEVRMKLSPSFTSPVIEKLSQMVLAAGAEAIKICGAGGGGCVLVLVKPRLQQNIINLCRENGYKVLNTQPVLGPFP